VAVPVLERCSLAATRVTLSPRVRIVTAPGRGPRPHRCSNGARTTEPRTRPIHAERARHRRAAEATHGGSHGPINSRPLSRPTSRHRSMQHPSAPRHTSIPTSHSSPPSLAIAALASTAEPLHNTSRHSTAASTRIRATCRMKTPVGVSAGRFAVQWSVSYGFAGAGRSTRSTIGRVEATVMPGNLARIAQTADDRLTFRPSAASRWRLLGSSYRCR